jgi:hypothetical protein
MSDPVLADNGDVLVPVENGESLRIKPGESDYEFWLERTRPNFQPRSASWDGPLTARQLVTIFLILGAIAFVIVSITVWIPQTEHHESAAQQQVNCDFNPQNC